VLGTGEIGEDAIKAGYPFRGLGAVVNFPCSVAILHGDKEFSDKIAEAIQSMRDDGSLSKIMIKWYGTDRSIEK
ncbi:MAG: transporter substrate-binding domain-containing protein, partial [Mesorhizobium sp.]